MILSDSIIILSVILVSRHNVFGNPFPVATLGHLRLLCDKSHKLLVCSIITSNLTFQCCKCLRNSSELVRACLRPRVPGLRLCLTLGSKVIHEGVVSRLVLGSLSLIILRHVLFFFLCSALLLGL